MRGRAYLTAAGALLLLIAVFIYTGAAFRESILALGVVGPILLIFGGYLFGKGVSGR